MEIMALDVYICFDGVLPCMFSLVISLGAVIA